MKLLDNFNRLVTSENGIIGSIRRAVWSLPFLREILRAAVRTARGTLRSIGSLYGIVYARWVKAKYTWLKSASGEPKFLRILATSEALLLDQDWQTEHTYLPERLRIAFWFRERSARRLQSHASVYRSYLDKLTNDRARSGDLSARLANNEPLRIVIVNDVGYQYGAGVALRRQTSSLLLLGWDVHAVSFDGPMQQGPTVTGIKSFSGWQGGYRIRPSTDGAPAEPANDLIRRLAPDAIILGNLHGVPQPLQAVGEIMDCGLPVFVYMHDAYWVSGRCAAPLDCIKYLSGCDSACPTAGEFPRLAPEKIAQAWNEKAELFVGRSRPALIANSSWTLKLAQDRYGGAARTGIARLGIDHGRFAPMSKTLARWLLGVPSGKPVVVMGAVNVSDKWKGGPIFHDVHAALSSRDDLHLVIFGRSSLHLKASKVFDYVDDERMLALIFNTADIFVSTAIAESFGQVLMEAASCGIPTVALDVGGVRDIVIDGKTGLLAREQSAESVLEALDILLNDARKRTLFGKAGRRLIEERYTLRHQADAWADCLRRLG